MAETNDSFVNFQANLGINADNQLTDSSYGFNPITRNRTLLEWIHRGSWLGGVAIDVVADDMTRAGIEIKGKMDPNEIEAIEETATSLGIWNSINETIKWSRLYGGALAVLLIDGQDPASELRLNTIRKGQFCGLLVLDRWMVEPSMSDLITELGPNLGMPRFYRVTAQGPGLASQTIHHSRCIRLEGVKLPYWQKLMENLWGLSVLERIYDRMVSFDSATTGAAQLVYKSYLRTFKVENLREIVSAGGAALDGLTRYVDMMRRFQSIEGFTLLDSKDDFNADTHNAFSGLSDALQQFGQQLSGALQIPLVRLFGQSPAGFSTGETDLRSYYDTIQQQQEKDLRVGATKVYRALAASEGIEWPEGTRLTFKPLWQMSEEQKANISNTISTSVSQLEGSGIISTSLALKELKQSSQYTGIFTNITEEMIESAEETAPAPEELEDFSDQTPTPIQKPNLKLLRTHDSTDFSAGILFVANTGEFLLICRGPQQDHPREWSVPCGHLEEGESFEQAARRECEEEIGFEYEGPLHKIFEDEDSQIFEAEIDEQFQVKLSDESAGFLWTTISALPSPLHPKLKILLQNYARRRVNE